MFSGFMLKYCLYYVLLCDFIFPPVAKLDIAADSDSEGRGFESLRAGQKIRQSSDCLIFIQSEGLVCNPRQRNVIRLHCKRYVIKSQDLYFFTFGLITYLSSKVLHPHLRCDNIPTSLDNIHGSAVIQYAEAYF